MGNKRVSSRREGGPSIGLLLLRSQFSARRERQILDSFSPSLTSLSPEGKEKEVMRKNRR